MEEIERKIRIFVLVTTLSASLLSLIIGLNLE